MSAQKLQLNNNQAVRLLCRLGKMLAVAPSTESVNKFLFFNSNSKFYAICAVLLIIIMDVLVTVGRSVEVYPSFPSSTVVLTDMILNIGLTAANISAVIIPSLIRRNAFQIFYDSLIKADYYFPIQNKQKIEKSRTFHMELIIGHLAIILLFSYDAFVWINRSGFTIYRHYIFRNFQTYHLYITIMIIYNFLLSIKLKIAMMNDVLKELTTLSQSANIINNCWAIKIRSVDAFATVRKISQMFEVQIQQMHLFNKLFGWQIFFQTSTIMLGLLNAVDLLTVFTFLSRQDNMVFQAYDLLIVHLLWSAWQIILGVIVIVSCAKVSEEAQTTSDICFSVLLKLDVESKNTQNEMLRKELQLLSKMAMHRCPSFTAAGMFPVDCSLMLAVFGSITTYAIVLIQFNK